MFIPWVHRLKLWDAIYQYVRIMSRFGLGKYQNHHGLSGISIEEFAEKYADYMYFWTHYRSEDEVQDWVRFS